jgi:hypothetical protein
LGKSAILPKVLAANVSRQAGSVRGVNPRSTLCLFKDMTSDVLQKEKTRRMSRKQPEGEKRWQSFNDIVESAQSTSSLHTPVLLPSVADRATHFFFKQYVCNETQPGNSHISPRGHLEYLPVLYLRSPAGILNPIVKAVALASFGNAGNVSEWKSRSFKLYGAAIYKIKEALQDPAQIKTDETLAAVMLMGTFEVGEDTSLEQRSKLTCDERLSWEWRSPL